jgi:hypothetical protein
LDGEVDAHVDLVFRMLEVIPGNLIEMSERINELVSAMACSKVLRDISMPKFFICRREINIISRQSVMNA